MAYVSKIEDYDVKDKEARSDISNIKNLNETQNTKINELVEKTNIHTENISSLTSLVNNANTNISTLQSDVDNLKNQDHLSVNYNASTETITFS